MGMLSRYQKSGGFLQLIQLIETCGKQKQENFLNMIEQEDPRWAQAIKDKMLSIERILTWENAVLAEIAGRLQDLTIATALHGFKPEDQARFLQTISHSQKRNIEDLRSAKTPSAAELSSALIKVLQEVRGMITQGYIRLDKIAPDMVIPEDIEDKLGKPGSLSFHASESTPSNVTPLYATSSKEPVSSTSPHDTQSLNTKVIQLSNENNQLKSEIKILRDKLAQIRRIA